MLGEWLEEFNFNKFLDREPSAIRHPLLNDCRNWNIFLLRAEDEEVHLLVVVFGTFNNSELEKTEDELSQEDQLVSDEETTLHPLVDGHTDIESKINNTFLFIFIVFGVLNSLKEEGLEGFKRVLVHVVHVVKGDE